MSHDNQSKHSKDSNQETYDSYWRAVLERDKSAGGLFVYAVKSTGVYCRSSCPSRRPKRENVEFYRTPEEAEAAGYRPCLRCHPKGQDTATTLQAESVERARRWIEQSVEAGTRPTLEALGSEVGLSPYHLQRLFKREVGLTPREYASAVRLRRLKEGLRNGDSVTGAMVDAGYGSSSRLYEQAGGALGMTPSSYRSGGAGMDVRYTTFDSRVGRVLVAATERGLCAVSLGADDAELERGLRAEYPAAHVKRDDAGLQEWARRVAGAIDRGEAALDLPLDIEGTPFEARVWQELRAIPAGVTRSYGEIARAIGQPSAVRAVAQACGRNHVAVIIPCHRVVRGDGTTGGYRWGTQRKEMLLRSEAAAHSLQEAATR